MRDVPRDRRRGRLLGIEIRGPARLRPRRRRLPLPPRAYDSRSPYGAGKPVRRSGRRSGMSQKRTPFLAAGLAVALALAGAALAATVSRTGTATTTTIKVTEREYRIALSATSAKAGSV